MLTLVKSNLRQRLKSPVTWLMVFFIFMLCITWIKETQNQQLLRPFVGHDAYRTGGMWFVDYTEPLAYIEHGDSEMLQYSAKLITDTQRELAYANTQNNLNETLRLTTFYMLVSAKRQLSGVDSIQRIPIDKKLNSMWDEVSGGILYEDVDFTGFPGTSNPAAINKEIMNAKYYYELYKNNTEPVYKDDVNNINYLYNFQFRILPYLILFLGILYGFNTINGEKNRGSLKLVLTQSVSRFKFYISRWISGVLHIMITILIPIITTTVAIGIKNRWTTLGYPVMYVKGSLSSLTGHYNHYDAVLERVSEINFFPHNLAVYPPSSPIISNIAPVDGTQWIPFYQYLLMVILLSILYIGFLVALIQLISSLINNEGVSLVSSILVAGLATIVSLPLTKGEHLNFSPFGMMNASRTVIGINNSTVLSSILILITSTVILLMLGGKYFKKKEI